MAASVLYRVLARTLRDQSKNLDFRSAWPRRPGLKGFAAAGCVVDPQMLLPALEWEDLLHRSEELRVMPLEFLRPFFSPHTDRTLYDLAWYRIQAEYPALATLMLGSEDPIDRGFAALRRSFVLGTATNT